MPAEQIDFTLVCVNFHWLHSTAYLLCSNSGSPDPSGADTQGVTYEQMLALFYARHAFGQPIEQHCGHGGVSVGVSAECSVRCAHC